MNNWDMLLCLVTFQILTLSLLFSLWECNPSILCHSLSHCIRNAKGSLNYAPVFSLSLILLFDLLLARMGSPVCVHKRSSTPNECCVCINMYVCMCVCVKCSCNFGIGFSISLIFLCLCTLVDKKQHRSAFGVVGTRWTNFLGLCSARLKRNGWCLLASPGMESLALPGWIISCQLWTRVVIKVFSLFFFLSFLLSCNSSAF